MDKLLTLGFAGNPNCGKTTLFNAITGASLKVANWPGVTVERIEGVAWYEGRQMKLVDLPGIYSLPFDTLTDGVGCPSSRAGLRDGASLGYSLDELVSGNYIMGEDVDVIINVVDASSLERNLYLTMQLIRLRKPVIVALNMMDVVKKRRMELNLPLLSKLLGGIPVIPVSGRKRMGITPLLNAAAHCEKEIRAPGEMAHSSTAYDYIEKVVKACTVCDKKRESFTEKADALLVHPVLGVPVFLLAMAGVFFLTFTAGDFFQGYFELCLKWFSLGMDLLLQSVKTAPWLRSLVVDGVIAGVGGVLTFLPNIFILFLALALLEDCGYMARVAYVMNGIMGKAGLSGKAFLPMILGFGCSVPAIMAARVLESERDRKRTMLLIPFMSCSAKLPAYVLFSEMFFGGYAVAAAFSLYVAGVALGVFTALILEKLSPSACADSLLLELPEYKAPDLRTIGITVWEKIKDYVTRAGTIIFLASMVLWFVLNYNGSGMAADVSESFGAGIGRLLVPVLAPAGLGMWQIGVALLSGLSAKEVVVSAFSVLFAVNNVNSGDGMRALSEILRGHGFTAVNAYSFLVFCLLYTPCAAAVGVIKKESNSYKFTVFVVVFQLLVAWLAACVVYQTGRMLH